MFRFVKVRENERAFLFRDTVFQGVLRPGRRVYFDPLFRVKAEVVSVKDVWLPVARLAEIVKSGALGDEALVLDLKDGERALVWVNGRFQGVFAPGLAAAWKVFHEVKAEVVDARPVRFVSPLLATILETPSGRALLDVVTVEAGHVGLFFLDGTYQAALPPGTHAFWKGQGRVRVTSVDLREQTVDVNGQEIMTADKVTLRLNAVVTFQVADPLRAVTATDDFRQALYREAQLSLRAVVGTRDLDVLLSDKDGVAAALQGLVKGRAEALGLTVVTLGIRDVILPGEMKELLNKVTEAKKAAEATLITRREETAAARSQANTAKILAENPMLLRLRELEALEKVSEKAKLNVVLGDKGLADAVVKLV